MECPYCHGELEAGAVISLRDPIYWCPEGEKAGWFTTRRGLERRGGFRLTRGYGKAEAWYCRTCNRLTVFNAK
ncbi:MAG: hypothetical protein K2M15_02655 [Oscillospiraceae bacterium]|nr:hypothetical protein [Oscillospiraceae bacterium]MDE7170493.1 hypothetical protein [Oscillospiraceae bacterium]